MTTILCSHQCTPLFNSLHSSAALFFRHTEEESSNTPLDLVTGTIIPSNAKGLILTTIFLGKRGQWRLEEKLRNFSRDLRATHFIRNLTPTLAMKFA